MNRTPNNQDRMSAQTNAKRPDLALIRTDLANERTLLAYGRTSLMLVGTGVSLVKFLTTAIDLIILGWILMGFGLLVGTIGVVRFTLLKRRLKASHGDRPDAS